MQKKIAKSRELNHKGPSPRTDSAMRAGGLMGDACHETNAAIGAQSAHPRHNNHYKYRNNQGEGQ